MTTPAPALLFLHGAVLNGRMWDPVAAALGADFRIAAPDLPGHGARAGEPFTLEAAGAVVRATAQALAPAPVVLCGDSLGGYVALASARGLGAQLQGGVLAGWTTSFRGPAVLGYLAQIALSGLLPPDRLQARLAQRIRRDYAAGPAVLEAGIRPAAFAEAVAELRRADFRALLAAFPAPVLLLNGARDWGHRLGERGARAARRDLRLHHIPGVGHGVSLHRPADFAAQIRRFINAHQADFPVTRQR